MTFVSRLENVDVRLVLWIRAFGIELDEELFDDSIPFKVMMLLRLSSKMLE